MRVAANVEDINSRPIHHVEVREWVTVKQHETLRVNQRTKIEPRFSKDSLCGAVGGYRGGDEHVPADIRPEQHGYRQDQRTRCNRLQLESHER